LQPIGRLNGLAAPTADKVPATEYSAAFAEPWRVAMWQRRRQVRSRTKRRCLRLRRQRRS
jgi:hypothetical protein